MCQTKQYGSVTKKEFYLLLASGKKNWIFQSVSFPCLKTSGYWYSPNPYK